MHDLLPLMLCLRFGIPLSSYFWFWFPVIDSIPHQFDVLDSIDTSFLTAVTTTGSDDGAYSPQTGGMLPNDYEEAFIEMLTRQWRTFSNP